MQVTGEGSGFYNEFFGNFLEGLHSKQNVLTSSDTQITIRSFVECFRFLLMKRSGDMELVAYLINSLVRIGSFANPFGKIGTLGRVQL